MTLRLLMAIALGLAGSIAGAVLADVADLSKLPPAVAALVTYGNSRLQEHCEIAKKLVGGANRRNRGIDKVFGIATVFSIPAAKAVRLTLSSGS